MKTGTKVPCDPTKRFEFTFAEWGDAKAGNWTLDREGNPTPYLVCPECGHTGRIGNHSVTEAGVINPSIVCPMGACGDGVARCSAHYYGKLKNWDRLALGPMPKTH